MARNTNTMLQKHEDHLTCLPFGKGLRNGLGSFAYEVPQKHYEFSITVVRKSVIDIPDARTICGTSEAEVIPGMVFTSRK